MAATPPDDPLRTPLTPVNVSDDRKALQEALEALKEARRQIAENKVLISDVEQYFQQAAAAEKRAAELEVEREGLIEQLRELQRERDPERVDKLVAERVAAACAARDAQITGLTAQLQVRANQVEELSASKRRLREALDRLKRSV